ncbi:hypothetical protein IMAU30143_01834 [Lactobacillus helveticus]|uniref:Eco57I restriction-modification methylase domain-containing protein n=1 Tax=Lactobacillus helveticus TaxID=1587 RepID=UPI0015622FAE|nr:restriction endonuclease [Lactobacillus helveticus]NRO31612.1 hypothetical protein [Lactobacillus helveticus]
MNKINEQDLLDSMMGDQESINILADYFGYSVGKNPVNPDSDLRIYFTDKTEDKNTGVMAVVATPDLTESSNTIQIRKLYEQVIDIKDNQLGSDFTVFAVAFIGKKRIVFFPIRGGNRDTRLDINLETIKIDLYRRNLHYLTNEGIVVEESPFGFGAEIKIDDKAFRRELSSGFLTMVSLYRKKLSEWITASDLKKYLENLVSDKAKVYIEQNNINELVQNESYKNVLSTVVDTISLRQLMRRFLEGYYGPDSFNVDGIALGVGDGTLDEAIEKAVNIAKNVSEEKKIKKLNKQRTSIVQLDLFAASFTPEELKATSQVQVKDDKKDYLADLSKKASKQFELAYGGDLFAGSIGEAATKIDNALAKENDVDWAKPYIDTKEGNFSFRFEDMPPEAIEKQYEDSMSQNVKITLDKKTHEPVVFFGDDEVEQKNKGAYYTDQRFVNYMINQTVAVEFQKRYDLIKKAIKDGNNADIDKALKHLLDLKIADFSCGGGSFLRGAFLKLADKYPSLASLDLPQEIRDKYNFLNKSEDSQYKWEDYVMNHMIYGVDIDYKAIIISSLTLTLSSLEHKPKNTKLPQLIGRTLIHANSLINAVPYYKRQEIFSKYQKDIAKLRKLKSTDFNAFVKLRDQLTEKVTPECGAVSKYASFLEIGCIEFCLPEIFFNEDGTLKEHGGLDIVIGNPPWEIWKPNSDEFFTEYDSSYRSLPNKKAKKQLEKKLIAKMPEIEEKWKEEQERIKAGSKYYRSTASFHYQTWKVNERKTSSDLNLYKVSLERFTQLAKPSASFSILVPDNFATDNGSTGLRHLVIDHYDLKEFLSFENRKGIFEAIDRRYKFACLTFKEKSKDDSPSFKAFFYRKDLNDLNNNEIKLLYPFEFLFKMEPERYSMVESRDKEIFNLFKKIRTTFAPLRDTNLISLRRDFDRTNDADKFINIEKASGTDIPMFEGKYINQFKIQPQKIQYAISKQDVQAKISNAFQNYRIAIRSIASSTNKRSLIVTLLPKNSTCAHSLWVQRNASKTSISDQLFILAVLNSYVLDFCLRQLITMNISQIYLEQLPLPQVGNIKDSQCLIQISKELLKENRGYFQDLDKLVPGDTYSNYTHDELIAELNARVMIDYDLTREEIVTLMKTFESAKHKQSVQKETQRIIDCYDKLSEEK